MTEEKEKEGIQMMEMRGIIRMLKVTAGRAEDLVMTGGPIHGSGIQIDESQFLGNQSGRGAFAGPSRAVYGDYFFCHTMPIKNRPPVQK